MTEQRSTEGLAQQVATVTWLSVLSAFAVVKIIVGFIYIDGGCHGICLLPYYFLITGVLSLAPVAIALAVTCSEQQAKSLADMWDCVGKILFLAVFFIVAGTFYILASTVRVPSLDRLCSQSWVPVFALVALLADWVLFLAFLRLFCSANGGPDPGADNSMPVGLFPGEEGSSPFHVWKLRHTRRTL